MSIRRVVDIVVGGCWLALAAPVMLAIAILIKRDSPGPIFYVPKMVGEYGQLFPLVRFRTMHTTRSDSPDRAGELTPVGSFIREYSLDHLPMLFNFVFGQLTLVGPRPMEPTAVDSRDPQWQSYFGVRPGLINYAVLTLGRSWTPTQLRAPERNQALELAYLVTMPHKFTAHAYCATTAPRSRLLGAVSVIRRNPDGSWHGDMLDGLAFVKAQKDHGAQPENARALLVGAGGAGSAIAIALLEAGVRELIIHDTNAARLSALVKLVTGVGHGRVRGGAADPTGCDMVCNATPLGMAAGDPLPVPADLLSPAQFVGDVIAGHGETPLVAAARTAGCMTANGDHMVAAVQEMMLDFMLGAGPGS